MPRYVGGQRTLGQEYCDLLPIHLEKVLVSIGGAAAGNDNNGDGGDADGGGATVVVQQRPMLLTSRQRLALCMLQAIMPYIDERHGRGTGPWQAIQRLLRGFGRSGEEESAGAGADGGLEGGGGGLGFISTVADEAPPSSAAEAGAEAESAGPSRRTEELSPERSRAMRALRHLARLASDLPMLQLIRWLHRLHTMFFFFNDRYHEVSQGWSCRYVGTSVRGAQFCMCPPHASMHPRTHSLPGLHARSRSLARTTGESAADARAVRSAWGVTGGRAGGRSRG